jgi:hypothetical protein
MEKIFINCPFDDKEECKSLGGKWDAKNKSWFITSNLDVKNFEQWILAGAAEKVIGIDDSGRTYLNCPFQDKDDCKSLGAFWDAELGLWFVPEGKDTQPFSRWLFQKSDTSVSTNNDGWQGKSFKDYQFS